MAELHVQPKRNNYWWIWLLLAIIIIGGAIYYYVNYYQKGKTLTGASNTDSTSFVNTDSTSANTAATDSTNINPGQANLWDQIDFNSPDTTYPEVTGKNVKTRSNAHFVIYSLSSQNLFVNNKSDLSNEGRQSLNQVGSSINKRFSAADVKVYDQADTSRPDRMAIQRAETVANYLVNNSKLNESHVTVYQPTQTSPMRQKNNMVNIVVKR